MKVLLTSAILAFGFVVSIPALAETVKLSAALSGGEEMPPVSSTADGLADFTFDTDTSQLTYFVRYSGLSGVVTSADIRGPAGRDNIGPVVFHFVSADSPISGTKTLSRTQASELLAGQFYVELDTTAHQSGEIRGQIDK